MAHRDVGDHHVAVGGLLRPGHRDRPAHERLALADQEVGPEVGDRTRGDVRRGLRRGIQLDLARTRERRRLDRGLPDERELVRAHDAPQLVGVLDQPHVVHEIVDRLGLDARSRRDRLRHARSSLETASRPRGTSADATDTSLSTIARSSPKPGSP